MNSVFLFEMDTSMLGRVAALLIRDLSRSRVIFLALLRGQGLIVFILITRSLMVYRHGSRVDALSIRRKWN
jgi:energy-converting hydrogenase Eha subunit C